MAPSARGGGGDVVMPAEAPRTIRVHADGRTYVVEMDALRDALLAHLPPFLAGSAGLTGRQKAIRTGIKALLPGMLTVLGEELRGAEGAIAEQTGAALSLPKPQIAGQDDLLRYAVAYAADLICALVTSVEWEAACVQSPDGDVRLAHLAPRGALAAGAVDADPGTAAPASLPPV